MESLLLRNLSEQRSRDNEPWPDQGKAFACDRPLVLCRATYVESPVLILWRFVWLPQQKHTSGCASSEFVPDIFSATTTRPSRFRSRLTSCPLIFHGAGTFLLSLIS